MHQFLHQSKDLCRDNPVQTQGTIMCQARRLSQLGTGARADCVPVGQSTGQPFIFTGIIAEHGHSGQTQRQRQVQYASNAEVLRRALQFPSQRATILLWCY